MIGDVRAALDPSFVSALHNDQNLVEKWKDVLMQGVKVEKYSDGSLFLVTDLSPALKESLRRHLTSICHGQTRAQTTRLLYAYKNTIREFLKRYHAKNETTKLGMIGELLAHILLLEHYNDFDCASPFLNIEERSIKKGFDVVLYNRSTKELWITEVKSGQLHQDKDENGTCCDLLHTAKRDLKTRLNDNNSMLWRNAINGATNHLYGRNELFEAVSSILEDFGDQAEEEAATSGDKNVFLVAGLFSSLKTGSITTTRVRETHVRIHGEGLFRKVFAIAFQKGSCDTIVRFLEAESN